MKTTRSAARTLLATATLLTLASVHPTRLWATAAGTVAPSLETSLIQSLETCDTSERMALDAISGFGDKEKVTGSPAATAASHLQTSSICLDDILNTILGTTPGAFDPKTQVALKDLQKNLSAAFKSDGKAVKKLTREGKAKAIRKEIQKALDAKQAAKGNLQGTKGRQKDGPTHIPPSRFGIPGGPFYPNVYNANASARFASNPVKNAGWQELTDNAKVKRKRVKMESGDKVNIWEFRAKKRDMPMYADYMLNRSFGPPTYVAGTLGTYATKDKDLADLGQSEICYYLIRNNASLLFQTYGTCIAPSLTGVTLKRITENGSAGMMLFPGVRQLDVLTEFNGTHFTTWAGARGDVMKEIGATQAGWPIPWAHVTGSIQSFGLFGRAKLGLEGLSVFHDQR